MKILEKLAARCHDQMGQPPVTIAVLGDSVTQGCFECSFNPAVGYFGPCEYENSYGAKLVAFLHLLYPTAQINLINAGVGGDSAPGGLGRFDRDVAPYHPDLVIVGFALNDSGRGPDGLADYQTALDGIFDKVAALGAECILLTPNCMNDRVSPYLTEDTMIATAKAFLHVELDLYVNAAREVAARHGIPVCDVYARWQAWQAAGVNVTELLSNKLNHPIRELHMVTAYLLAETLFGN